MHKLQRSTTAEIDAAHRTPKWVKVSAAVAAGLALLLLVLVLTGTGHGPGRHLPAAAAIAQP